MDSSAIVQAPVVLQHINNPNAITFINSKLYKAAAKGQIDLFNGYTDPLNLLLTPTKNTILHVHITQQQKGAKCSVSFTQQILAKCPSLLLQTNDRGETPLHMAARYGHKDVVKFLVYSAKASHQDVEAGVGAARTMLRMESTDKETALHEAVRHNNPSVVQILTDEDPDFTYLANRLGETPLYLAVERRYSKMAVQILNTCSSPDFRGPIGRTALHEAVIRNISEETIAKIIQSEETLVKVADQKGWTPLHHASYLGRLSIVKQLLEVDESVAYMGDRDGMIPLHVAAARGNKAVVYPILEHCPDCHELTDNKGRNVLHFAFQSKEVSLLDRSVQGANGSRHYQPLLTNLINQKDVNGNTPLHLLATYCISNKALIKHPLVDKMAINNNNFTPLDVIANKTDSHDEGFKGSTLRCMRKANGYKTSSRNFVFEDRPPKPIDVEHMEKTKASHMIVAALVATVTFTAGFTMPGGYDSSKGTAILSRNRAFATFVITNTAALLLSLCALFFHYSMDMELDNRWKQKLLQSSASFIRVSILLMVLAFLNAYNAVLDSYARLGVSICLLAGIFVLIYFSPIFRLYDKGKSSHSMNVYENL